MAEETEVAELDLVPQEIETGWKNPPALKSLKEDYASAKLEHDVQLTKIKKWQNNLHITGSAKLPKVEGRSNVQPKLIRKQAEWRYPALTEPFLSTEDLFNVSPITWEDKAAAEQNQLVLNNQFNTKIDKVRFIDEYVRAAVDEGTVIVQVGWDNIETEEDEEVPVYQFTLDTSGQTAQQYMALAQLKSVDPEQYKAYVNPGIEQAIERFFTTGQALVPEEIGTEIRTKTVVVKNQPTVVIRDPNNIILDPSCEGDVDRAGFGCVMFETTLSDLKKKGIYHNLDKIKPAAASPLNDADYIGGADNANFSFQDEPRTRFLAIEYWGFWDVHGTGMTEPFVATWVNDTLIRMEMSPAPDKQLPFIYVALMPVKRSVFGEPDGELLIDNQKIVGAVTRGMIDLMGKSAAGQTGRRKDFLDITNRRKFSKGDDYEYNSNVDPRVGIFQHSYPEIPQSAYNMINLQNAEAESFSGVKAFNNGISSQSLGDVATGIRSALDAASKRELGILRRLAAGIVKIGRKIIGYNAVFLSDVEIIRITNDEFVPVRRDDLQGNFDLKLTISTAEEDDQKAKELSFMLQTIGPNVDPKITFTIMADIARLRKMPDVARKLEEYEPQPDPVAQEKAKLENMLLQAQIQKELAMARSAGGNSEMEAVKVLSEQADAMLTFAKVATEKEKARNLQSDSDSKDLDYVEQESGVKQERDLQKIQGQAKAQAQTKIIEAQLKERLAAKAA